MPIADLLMSGVSLMVVGMGIVFIFLLVLVFVMKGMSRLAMLVSARQDSAESLAYSSAGAALGQGEVRGDMIAVISAAVSQYRATHS
jgi:oxaloacetate decarboxylase (Na+ extruding) subunit gamma